MTLGGENSFYLFPFDDFLISLNVQGTTKHLIFLYLNIFCVNHLLSTLNNPGCFCLHMHIARIRELVSKHLFKKG